MGYAEETERIETESTKRAKWDCRSVGSTYSNIYNHPAVIREEPKRKVSLIKKFLIFWVYFRWKIDLQKNLIRPMET
jgi:hypothetical protein